ncbi:MAG: glycosyltransferase, partial [Candidatus Poribacteria bacterium]|nr:glycosyltransferase [Candidatus Poribacteria bacterium]
LKGWRILEDSDCIVRQLIQQYNMEADFICLDFVNDIEKIYRASDIVLFPSHLRGIGRSALEAAVCGVPVVAATVHWNNDVVIHGKTGLLVSQHDVQSIADATVKLLKDEQLRHTYGVNARRHAEKHFHPKKNAKQVYQVYRHLLQQINR